MRGFACLLVLSLLGCQSKPEADPLVERAAFGVFFGGQIQDRKELPFELDPSKQSCGIRLDFRAPLARSLKVGWEISRPLREKPSKGGASADRVTEVGEVAARVGEQRLDVPVLLGKGRSSALGMCA